MKLRIFLNVFLVLSIFVFLSANIQQTAEQLYQSGIYKEEVEGDLEKAIAIYGQILKNFPENKSTAAKALYHIGLCYEKLGNQEAQKAYQRLIEEYPSQIKEVNLAKERLSNLAKAAEAVPHKPTFRKIRIPTEISGKIRLSPGGKKISLTSRSQKLSIMPLYGKLGTNFPGEAIELNTEDIGVEGIHHAWSGDGQWIAFNGDAPKEEQEQNNKRFTMPIYIVSSDGGKPKKIHENYRDFRILNYNISLSPYGKNLAFSSVNWETNEQHIYTVPIDGGEPKLLVDAQAREPVFSPDGKMIAYAEDKNLGRAGGGLWVVPAQGGTPKLVADAKMASFPTWSPDGTMIAFVDHQDEYKKIHIIPLDKDGEALGEMRTSIDVPAGISYIELAGWTPDNKIGAVFFKKIEFALYTVLAEGGRATMISHGGYPVQPRFSPDGKRIYHFNNAEEQSGAWHEHGISFVPVEGGKVTTIPLDSDKKIAIPAYGGGNRVSPDGKAIVFAGKSIEESAERFHIWILPIEGGTPKELTASPPPCSDGYPCWSPDGKTVAFVRHMVPRDWDNSKNYFEAGDKGETNIYIVNSFGGEPKPITTESDYVAPCPISWSPDGRMIAFFSSKFEDSPHKGTLKVISPGGGESRIIGEARGIEVNKELAWSPDSKRIAFNVLNPTGIKVMSLVDGSVVDVKTGLVDTKVYHLDWSPDGKKLVFGGYKGGGREFWLMEDFLPLVKRKK
jgi:Tol biopolymer transport system component